MNAAEKKRQADFLSKRREYFLKHTGLFKFDAKFCFKEELPVTSFKRTYPATQWTSLITNDARRALKDLCVRVSEGDEDALSGIVSTLTYITGNLIETLRRNPDFARRFTRKIPKVPVLLGQNKSYLEYAQKFVTQMEVGADLPLDIVKTPTKGRSSGAEPATLRNDVCLVLHEFIEGFRVVCSAYDSDAKRAAITVQDGQLPSWGKAALALHPLSKSNARDWANVGIAILEEAYGRDFSAVPKLRPLGVNAAKKYDRSAKGKKAKAKRVQREEHGTALQSLLPRAGESLTEKTSRVNINARIRSEIRGAMSGLAKRD